MSEPGPQSSVRTMRAFDEPTRSGTYLVHSSQWTGCMIMKDVLAEGGCSHRHPQAIRTQINWEMSRTHTGHRNHATGLQDRDK